MTEDFLSYFNGETAKIVSRQETDDSLQLQQIISLDGQNLQETDPTVLRHVARSNTKRLRRLLRGK